MRFNKNYYTLLGIITAGAYCKKYIMFIINKFIQIKTNQNEFICVREFRAYDIPVKIKYLYQKIFRPPSWYKLLNPNCR